MLSFRTLTAPARRCGRLLVTLVRDEAGFVISAELVLVATIAVLALIVGLSGLSLAVNKELDDVARSFYASNQSYRYGGWAQGNPNETGDFGAGSSSSSGISITAPTGEQ